MSTRIVWGIRNYAFFNRRADGDDHPVGSKREALKALSAWRSNAIKNGLSLTAARAGIVLVYWRVSPERAEELMESAETLR